MTVYRAQEVRKHLRIELRMDVGMGQGLRGAGAIGVGLFVPMDGGT